MRVIGIIAEYNPFHKGHAYMLEEVRRKFPDAAILAIMSGSFTQRGEAAILDKWQRAQMAVQGGCNLVLELPFAFAVRSAQDFARGAILLLEGLGIVNGIAFGMEFDAPKKLQKAAQLIDTERIQKKIHAAVREGKSYAAALTSALSESLGLDETLLKQPNTILAMEYFRTLHLIKSGITAFPIKRHGTGYHDTSMQESIASASAIRRELRKTTPDWTALARVLPETSHQCLKQHIPPAGSELLYRPFLARLWAMNPRQLQEIHGINEGLENRLLASIQRTHSLEELIQETASKRYPKSRIQRIVPHLLIGFSKEQCAESDRPGPQYARVLSFDDKGRELLCGIKAKGTLPLITKTSHFLTGKEMRLQPEVLTPLQRMLRLDFLASDLRELCRPQISRFGKDFLSSPVYVPF